MTHADAITQIARNNAEIARLERERFPADIHECELIDAKICDLIDVNDWLEEEALAEAE